MQHIDGAEAVKHQDQPSLVRVLNALGAWRSLVVIAVGVLAVFWLAIAVIFGVLPVGPGLTDRLGGVAAGDFMYFYPAGVLAGGGHAAEVYDVAALTTAAHVKLGPHVPELVWPYPPTMSLPLAVLGQFSPSAALALWIGLSLCSLLVLARLVFGQWRLAAVALLFPGSALALFTGQFSPVLALLLGLVFLGAVRSPLLGGIALGLFVWKPHFAIMPAAFSAYGRQGRMLAVATATGGTVVALSVAVFGLETWAKFFEAIVHQSGGLVHDVPLSRLVSVFAAAYTLGASLRSALAFHAVTAVLASFAALRLWKGEIRPSMRALGLTGATLLVPPYALDYDLIFLLLPWLLIIRECREDSKASVTLFWPWLALTCLVPVSYMVQLYTARSIAGPLLLAIVCGSWWRSRRSARLSR